ncbi:MAG: hypothetical protein O3B24_04640 [Verrucomicrobia bacterium]|nr:hypothetical protein [Verrucomicrobiota bacterium]
MGTLNTHISRRSPHPQCVNAGRQAFTLIELLTVMAIMIIMLGLTVVGFKDLGRGAGLRAGVMKFRTSLSQTRQMTITQRAKVSFNYFNTNDISGTRGVYYKTRNGVLLGTQNFLPSGIVFRDEPTVPAVVTFGFDGSISGSTNFGNAVSTGLRDITITEQKPSGGTTVLRVYPMTGRIRVRTGQP